MAGMWMDMNDRVLPANVKARRKAEVDELLTLPDKAWNYLLDGDWLKCELVLVDYGFGHVSDIRRRMYLALRSG